MASFLKRYEALMYMEKQLYNIAQNKIRVRKSYCKDFDYRVAKIRTLAKEYDEAILRTSLNSTVFAKVCATTTHPKVKELMKQGEYQHIISMQKYIKNLSLEDSVIVVRKLIDDPQIYTIIDKLIVYKQDCPPEASII